MTTHDCTCGREAPALEHARDCPVRLGFFGGDPSWDQSVAHRTENPPTDWTFDRQMGTWVTAVDPWTWDAGTGRWVPAYPWRSPPLKPDGDRVKNT